MGYRSILRATTAALAVAAAVGVAAVSLNASASASATNASSSASYSTTISVNAEGKAVGSINSQYVGLSFESNELNYGWFNNDGNLAQILKNLGTSVLRFGGNTVDRNFWEISPPDLTALAKVVKASGWSVLYSENLGLYNAGDVRTDVKRVAQALGSHLAAFACGNEPDLYVISGLRPSVYTKSQYFKEVRACFKVIKSVDRTAKLEGADFAGTSWLNSYAGKFANKIIWLGEHDYPLGCPNNGKTPQRLEGLLLGRWLRGQEVSWFKTSAAAARKAHAELRMTEANTACDVGVFGLSNSYASALWAVDYLLLGAEHGVEGMNFHGSLGTNCDGFTVLCMSSQNHERPQPIYYGMMLTHMLGAGRLIGTTVKSSSKAGNVTAFALRPKTGDGTRVMVENLSGSTSDTTLKISSHPGSVSLRTMTAPSLLATSGVKIQGKSVANNGKIRFKPSTVTCQASGCSLVLAPYTAVVVSAA